MLLVNNEIKTSIDNTSIPFNIKAKVLSNTAQKKAIKKKNCEEPDNENIDKLKIKDKNHINVRDQWSPSFKNHKSVLYRYLNKSLPKDVENLEDMPSESEYYKIISNENFLAYKSDTMLIFMSKMQAQILFKNNEHVFIDGTFFPAPKAVYQVVTIRNHDLINDIFYTVAYGLLTNKSMNSYVEFLDQIKYYVYANRENKRILEYNDPINIHCDFEMAIIRAVKQVYPNTEIKLCLWHLYRNLEINRNKIYGAIENQTQLSLNILKRIKTLSFIDPRYIIDVYEFIKEDAEDNEKDTAFVNYFETTYLRKYDPKNWNYYRVFDHRTNNTCESHNHVLKVCLIVNLQYGNLFPLLEKKKRSLD